MTNWVKVLAVLVGINSAAAEDVGIEFWKMKIGTQWLTQTIEDEQLIREETYLGEENGFFITEYYEIKSDGTRRFIFKNFYDQKGRRVRGERNGMALNFTPFQCRYAVGACIHESSIPYRYEPDNTKYLVTSSDHVNRLEGRNFYLGHVLSDGSIREYPFELGTYNLRIGSRYKNNAGVEKGFRLIEIKEP